MRVIGPHEIIFPDEKLCLMPVLNGLSLCLLFFELDTPPQINGRVMLSVEQLKEHLPEYVVEGMIFKYTK